MDRLAPPAPRLGVRVPRGRDLAEEVWEWRHAWLLRLLWLQGAALAVYGAIDGIGTIHNAGHLALILGFGLAGSRGPRPRTFRSVCVALGLFTESALLVHLADGAVAMHFHFFVMLAALSLYEDALPLFVGIVYVVLQHGVLGAIDPNAVYNDASSQRQPWLWAGIHGLFVLAAAVTQVLTWNANERVRSRLRRAEARARTERDSAERYLHAAGTMIVALDARGRVEVANAKACEVLGYEPHEVLGANWFQLALPEGDRAAARAAFERLLAAEPGAVAAHEGALLTCSGEARLVSWRDTVLHDGDGRPAGTLSSGLDVTDRRAAEAALAEQRRDAAALAGVTHRIARERDARGAVLEAARELTGGAFAMLLEPEGASTLAFSAVSGAQIADDERIRIGSEPSGAAVAFLSGEPFFVPEARDSPAVARRLVQSTGAASLLFQPAIVAGSVRGVLVIAWAEPVGSLTSRQRELAALLADEAAIAIDRAGHLLELERAATTDPLTGAANRRAWEDALEVELGRARRSGDPLCLALLDLDRFKQLNDECGHQAGDRVLKACVAAWRQQIRPTDVLARLGGDEFGLLLPGCGRGEAETVRDRIGALTPHHAGVSVGVSEWDGAEAASELLRRADRELYGRKAARQR